MTAAELLQAILQAARELPRDQVERLAEAFDRYPTPSSSARFDIPNVAATPAFRHAASRIVDPWLAEGAIPGPAVALALRACAATAEAERASEVVEIVWTGPRTQEVPVRLTSSALQDVIEAARKTLYIVSFAAYKVEAMLQALRDAAVRGANVRIILEVDRGLGGTLTFAAREAFESLKDVVNFYVWPIEQRPVLEKGRASLHAKTAIADDHTALVTSANFTGHAMGHNMELGLLVRGGPIPRRLARHFQQLIDDKVLERQL